MSFLKPNNPLLRKASVNIPVNKISTKNTESIILKMLKVANSEQKDKNKPIMVGLAAVQIGILKRIILVDLAADGKGKVGDAKIYINPEVIWESKIKSNWYEGCFSIPEVCGIVKRPKSIKVKAYNIAGGLIQEKHQEYIARIFQHEIDHLNGKFFVDLVIDPDNLHHVKPADFPSYRNKGAWRNWPKKHPLPLALGRLKKI